LSEREDHPPVLFHSTHWKAGSQWVKNILRKYFPDRLIDPQIGITKVKDFAASPKQENGVFLQYVSLKSNLTIWYLPDRRSLLGPPFFDSDLARGKIGEWGAAYFV
jgi:hypothetical protein